MPSPSFWSRIRSGQLIQVLVVYVGASWVLLQVVNELSEALALPDWVSPVAVILLLIGLLIILATAWVQSHPLVDERAQREEVPDSWELDLRDAARTVARGRLPHLTWARALTGGGIAFLLLFGFAGMYIVIKDRGESLLPTAAVAESAPQGIAVLPFTVRGEEIGDWREGMVDLLSTGLDGAGGVRAIASSTVLARWAETAPAGETVAESTALEVARRTGARYALLGSAVAIGPRVRVTGDLHLLDGDRRIGQVTAEGPPDSVLALVDRLAVQTLALLSDQDDGTLPRIDVAAVTTSSLPALKAYLEGESLFRRGEFPDAAAALERAVREDSLFALAYYRLSQAYGWGESIESVRVEEATARTMELIDRLPSRERLFARISSAVRAFDAEALELGREAVRTYPDDPEAWYLLGEAQLHVRASLMGWEEAEESYQRAIELAPRFVPYRIHMVEAAVRYHADSTLTAQRLDALEELAPESPTVARYRIVQDLAFGDSATYESALERVRDVPVGPEMTKIQQELGNPLLWDRQGRLLRDVGPRLPAQVARGIQTGKAWGLAFARGRFEEAMELMSSPGFPPEALVNLQAILLDSGLELDTPELDAAVRRARDGDIVAGQAFPVALTALNRGNEVAFEAALRAMRARHDSLRAAGDTAAAQQEASAIRTLEAARSRVQGQPERAIRLLEEERPFDGDGFVAWWLGEMHAEQGNLQDAERYFKWFQSWDPDPIPAYELGKVYHRMGEREKARRWLEFFVLAWEDADPAAQPMLDDARQRLAELSVE